MVKYNNCPKRKVLWIGYKRLNRDVDHATWYEMQKQFIKMGIETALIFPYSGSKPEAINGVIFLKTFNTRILFSIGFSLRLFFFFINRLWFNAPYIVICDYMSVLPLFAFMFLARCRVLNSKFILDVRTIPVEVYDSIDKIKEYLFYQVQFLSKHMASGFTVITSSMHEQLCRRLQVPKEKIGIWSSGVSPIVFQRPETRISLKKNENQFIVMYHGAISRSRGLVEAVQAMEIVKKNFPQISLVIIGRGGAVQEIKALIERLGLDKQISLLDAVPYSCIPLYIDAADVGIIPFPKIDWWEVSSPLKLLEYLMMEKPVIVTDIAAHRHIINFVDCAYVIRNCNPNDIALAIIKAYLDRANLCCKGRYGKKFVIENYTWEKQANRFVDYLDSVI